MHSHAAKNCFCNLLDTFADRGPSGKSGPKDQVALHYYYTSPSHWFTNHDSRGIEIVNFTISLALSAGTLMASAGTPYRLVPAHFYPCEDPITSHNLVNKHVHTEI